MNERLVVSVIILPPPLGGGSTCLRDLSFVIGHLSLVIFEKLLTLPRPCLARGSVEGFDPAEEVSGLEGRRIRTVRTVSGVALDRLAEVIPNSAGSRLRGIGGPHEVAPDLDRIFAGEDHQTYRPFRH